MRRKITVGSSSKEKVQNGPSLPPPTRDDALWISPLKYPDVSLWYNNEVTLQTEVVSNYDLKKQAMPRIDSSASFVEEPSFQDFGCCRVHISWDKIVDGNFQHLYINAVIQSLKILHEEANIAHLDIRIENICWDDQSHAVFIDLDRSADADARAEEYIARYGMSNSNWTTKQVDYPY